MNKETALWLRAINEDNKDSYVKTIVEDIGLTAYKTDANQTDKMFHIHNFIFKNTPEYTKSCGGCRMRVWNRLKEYYLNNNLK